MKGQADTYGVYYTKLHLKEGKPMKSYRSTDSFHMVGQAWQIRIMLQQWQKQWGSHITVKELLKKTK